MVTFFFRMTAEKSWTFSQCSLFSLKVTFLLHYINGENLTGICSAEPQCGHGNFTSDSWILYLASQEMYPRAIQDLLTWL